LLDRSDVGFLQRATGRGATRRKLFKMLTAAGVTVGLGSRMIAAAARADSPKKGGRIRVAGYSSSTADTLDPAKQSLSTDYARCNMFYNGLTTLDDHLVPQLELADAIEHEGATDWIIKLKKGITFHDGKPLTADDVVYSLSRHKDPSVGSKAASLAAQMAEIKATAPDEVRIHLSSPNADLPVVLGTFHFLIVKGGTTGFATAVGTGPFKCKEFKPGEHSIAVRNEGYWKSGRPYLDEIEMFAIADESARVNALLSGDVHLIGSIDPRSAPQVKSASGFEIMESRSGNYTDFVMRLDSKPGSDPDFVLGMKYLFDREQMKSSIFRGYADVANDQPIPPTGRYYASDIPQRPFDPEKAKFHLNKAGVLNATIPIVASPAASSSVEMAVLLQQAAQRIGLNLDIKRVPADGYWSNYWMKVPVGFGNINPRPTADILFTLFFKSDAPWNESAWKNEKFDQLLVAARAETDDTKRKQMYRDMQLMVHENSGIGIPLFISNLDAHTSKLKGLRPMATGGLMGFGFGEHVWLES
jgi:peptide/nickel transport system substrate-binding protein